MPIPTGLASTKTLTDIANAIRYKSGESRRYQPSEMADAVEALDGTQEPGGMQYPYGEPSYGRLSMLPYTAIANAIRGQNGETRDYKPCEMADAIRALEWPQPKAYALLTYPESGTNAQKLLFVKTLAEPMPMSMYNGMAIQEVYTDFEDAIYTSNSQVPWYSKHDNITEVEFCDWITPKSCAYWFYMFRNCTSFDLNKLDLTESISMAYMFYYCSAVTSLSLMGHDASLVEIMKYCFYYCSKLATVDLRYMDMGSVVDFTECFRGCSALTELKGPETWYVSSACQNTLSMFNGCSKLATLKLGTWDLSGVANAMYMFQRMSAVTEIDMSNVTWSGTTTNINSMFNGDGKLVRIYAKAGTALTGATASTSVFYNCYNLKGGAGSALNNSTSINSSYIGGAYARVDGVGGLPGYFTVK